MGENFKITYDFQLLSENTNIKELSLDYWENKKFICVLNSNEITGKRGSNWGNLTSFDMTNLICELRVDFRSEKHVRAELFVTGKFQDITDVNLWAFKLELILFHRTLNELAFPDFMNEYENQRKKSALKWSFTLMLKGRELTTELKEKFEKLTEGENLPVVEIEKR
jgi:hypothetical protein